ncbi:hypothetical protein DL95DRAFT_184414 [Leptodontidium sp. 2 PMI_412]|nr:hypothetical protein DL95DRAFT_184414 [Leptodontidium sp. 2 PMI_412]
MSIGPNIDSGYTQYGAERLASQTTGDNFGGGSYDMTERQAVYRQDSNEVEVQSDLLQQYSNTGTGFYSSQTPPWPAREGFSLGRPGLNTLADQPNVMATQDDQNMVSYGDEDEDDAEENETIRGSEEQEPAKKLFELEALYQPGQCHLPGCRKGHIFETFQSYRSHIRNVHSKALWCKFPSCPHSRPFANQSDLNRHNEAKHGDKSNKPHKCLRADCAARVKAFKRKDKLREHNTNYHPVCCCYLCPRLRWFESFQACAEHTNRHHVHVASG